MAESGQRVTETSIAPPPTLREILDLVLRSEDYDSGLAAVASLSLPDFGAWSIVDVIESPGNMRRLAIVHPDPEKQEVAATLPSGWPPETEDPIGAPVVMRTREPYLVAEVPDEMLVKFARNEQNLEALRELGIGSYVVVPLLVRDEVLGAVTFVSDRTGQSYGKEDIAQAEEMAALIALVVHNATLHRDTRQARDSARLAAAEAGRQRRDIERIMEVQSRLVSGFSHDVKNPLGAALGYSELLLDGLVGDLSPRQKTSLGRIDASLHTALELIEDLVDYASRNMGKLEIRPTAVDVAEAVRSLAEEYRAQVEGAGLELRLDISEDLPLITSDRVRVRQILSNLISNAVKYTDAGHIEVRAETAGSGHDPDGEGSVAIHVSDTGHGIPKEKQDLLFKDFARLDPEVATGVGLGLSMGRSIAHALGGEITVESAAGEGSTFTLWLPPGPEVRADGGRST